MFARALIVLLVVLNVGVAVWWMARGESAAVAPPQAQTRGVASLTLLAEVPPASRPKPAPPSGTEPPTIDDAGIAATTTPGDTLPVAAERCLAFGPFADAAQATAARTLLQPLVARLHERRTTGTPGRGWRVWLPPQADRAAAQAIAERIDAAGFDDYIVVNSGEEANSVSLGRYGNENAARQRESALRAGGFTDVVATPVGAATSETWIDVAAIASFSPDAPLRTMRGVQAKEIDCKGVS